MRRKALDEKPSRAVTMSKAETPFSPGYRSGSNKGARPGSHFILYQYDLSTISNDSVEHLGIETGPT